MLEHLLKASLGIALLLGGWLAVLTAWRRMFQPCSDEDVLAGRTVCKGHGGPCACRSGTPRPHPDPAAPD